jgi:DtxR family Mn-dependent transcriptional regulator
MTIEVTISILLVAGLGATAIAARMYRNNNRRRRILVEDALKHLYDFEYSAVTSTLESLAGAMGVPSDRAAKVLEELGKRRLVSLRGLEVILTDEGREYALKVIRVHRLWERHLSDETMVHELDWHRFAEQQEHNLTAEEVMSLSKRLGHPVYDPHGDPIPSPAGTLPSKQGAPLETFPDGEIVSVVHVEDEPGVVYAELIDAGIYPGMVLRICRRDDETIVVEREGEEIVISRLGAVNLRVKRDVRRAYTGQRRTLASLNPGSAAVVSGLSPACRGLQRRRLMDLGLVPGTPVSAVLRSPGGDPTAYNIRGTSIALRKQQAELVFVE